jgi:hypothetical protein
MANSFTVTTYSPNDVKLIIGGYQIAGWQNISIYRSAKSFNVIRGIRGKNTRVPNKDTSATIQISLAQFSPSNDVMSAILIADEQNGTARISLTLKDGSGGSVFSTNEAYITGFPSTVYSGGFEYRGWEIFCQSTDTYSIGGNTRPSTSLFDSAVSEATDFISNIF